MRAKDFTVKKRDPNWEILQAKRSSGAAGQHKDKKKAVKQGEVKHKNKEFAEEAGEINIADMQKQLAELENRKDTLRHAVQEARKITTDIKYDDTVMSITTRIQQLAEKVGIDAKEIQWAIKEVEEKANELESAVYALDDAFTDAYRDADNKAAELEYEIDDYQNQSRRQPE